MAVKPTKGAVKPTKAAPVKTGMAGLYGGSGPNGYVNQLFAPQETQTAAQQQARMEAFQGLVRDFLASQKDVGAQLAPYTAAAGQQSSDARNAAAGLAAANPNAVTQNDLAAINAPQSQRDAVTGQNQTAFGGNAALLNYTGGVIPSDQFKSDAAARASFLASLPLQGEALGVQGFNALSSLASKENLALAGNKVQSLQQARTDLANFVQKNQAARADAAKTAFSQNLAVTKYNTGVDEFNTRTKLSYQRMAQQALQSDRSYGIALSNLGLRKRTVQLQVLKNEAKLKSGGFTPSQLNRFSTDAQFVARQVTTAKALPSYSVAMSEMLARHVPLSIAAKELNKIYPATAAGRPITDKMLSDYNALTGVTSSPKANDVVGFASDFLGVPYKWGGTSSKGMDCSAFTQAALARVGVKIPRTTYAQVKYGKPVTLAQLAPGDLVFTEPGKNGPNHVGMYIGNGQIQESPHTGDVNKIIDLNSFLSGGFVAARRYIGG